MRKTMDIVKYWTPFVRSCLEFQALARIENGALEDVWENTDRAFAEQFIDTATEYGIGRWEKMLQITPKASDDMVVRRFRVLAKINETLPFTYRALEKQLSILCGERGYQLQLFPHEYRLTVKIDLTVKKKYEEVAAMLKRIVPANLVMDVSLQYNNWNQARKLTWNRAALFSWTGMREEAIIDCV